MFVHGKSRVLLRVIGLEIPDEQPSKLAELELTSPHRPRLSKEVYCNAEREGREHDTPSETPDSLVGPGAANGISIMPRDAQTLELLA